MCSSRLQSGSCALLALAVSSGAGAVPIPDMTSTTLFSARPYASDGQAHDEANFYELLSLMTPATTIGPVGDLRVVLRGWGRVAAGEPQVGSRGTGDVDVAYVEGNLFNQRLLVRAGRQMLTEGAARNTQVDGVSVAASVWRGLGVEAYGGSPVSPRLNFSRSDATAGGRVFWRAGFDAEVGASIAYAQLDGILAREDVALDAWWRLSKDLTIGGSGQWSLYEARFSEGRLVATWRVDRRWQVTADAQRSAPDLFIARSSIFSVFSQERRDEAGAEVALRLGPRLSAYLEGHWLAVQAGNGFHTGGKVTWHPLTQAPTTTCGAEIRILDEPSNGFAEFRLFGMHTFPHRISATLELDGYRLNELVNGRRGSFMVNATAAYPIAAHWDAMLAGSMGSTPYLDRRFDVSARVAWKFSGPGGRP